MIDEEIKAVVLVILLASAAIAVYPILAEGRIVEPFSELGILGPNMKLGDYPREVKVEQAFDLYLYVGNHEGTSQYYRVLAKLGEMTQNISDVTPLDAPVEVAWETLLNNDANTTIPIQMRLHDPGLNKRLVFELWRYDSSTHDFVYHERWIQLWLNVTSTR